ncbi:hypothetical protein LUZ60_003767 [Juncus effusus]|nr:hypothetical protein LUZ60_003767 [Juncus effusus]
MDPSKTRTKPDPLSYPPPFRPNNLNQTHQPPLQPSLLLPVLNLQNLDANLLHQSCSQWGMFRLTNHGVPPGLSARVFELAREIFSRPFERKEAELGPEAAVRYFYGTPAMVLKVKEVNWLEGLHVSVGKDEFDVGDVNFGEFRVLASEYSQHMMRIAKTLFNTISNNLNLNKDVTNSSYLSDLNGMLRAYRYPICPDPLSYLGMEAHTDSSLLTVLNHDDDVAGLQVFWENEWCDVQPESGTLIVNLGDMMHAISDDKYKNVEHRVLANAFNERVSIGYFVFPEEECMINSSSYRPFSYKEFKAQVQEDIVKFGSKVGLKLFRKENSKIEH